MQSSGSLFFFQAEDGIRDLYVTGVQTCALPISITSRPLAFRSRARWLAAMVWAGSMRSSERARNPSGSGCDVTGQTPVGEPQVSNATCAVASRHWGIAVGKSGNQGKSRNLFRRLVVRGNSTLAPISLTVN